MILRVAIVGYVQVAMRPSIVIHIPNTEIGSHRLLWIGIGPENLAVIQGQRKCDFKAQVQ